jgi:hypothetical protein
MKNNEQFLLPLLFPSFAFLNLLIIYLFSLRFNYKLISFVTYSNKNTNDWRKEKSFFQFRLNKISHFKHIEHRQFHEFDQLLQQLI